ncbi:MAG: glycoside hydrolase family 16 protein, partial [Cellulomonadaceae bacterium]|nr:glycoside hydrolase family 16 protein [Cellulomonadaceae bacterium]
LDGDGLTLLVEADQPAWRPDDGALRVSNVQTGTFSGPTGSTRGQHHHQPGLRVVTPQPTRALWTPRAGMVEATMRAPADPTCMLALWLVGFEESSPLDSGEICVAELFGDAIGPTGSRVRLGIKAHHDPRLRTEVVDVALDIDATQEHTYAARWDARRTVFLVDGAVVATIDQGVDYPLQLMVDLFEFPATGERAAADYPKSALVTAVRGYEPGDTTGPRRGL